ncbi:MAG: hypothetical protein H7336_05245 [Bacteriovorax sp.]|nr:hypothetical protein [Bacteriovorax sp.]
MKAVLVLSLMILSLNVYSQSTKAVQAVVPESAQINKDHKKAKKEAAKKVAEAPCDTKEDLLKKLEEKKKASAESGKGFSLQGKTDTGCTIK